MCGLLLIRWGKRMTHFIQFSRAAIARVGALAIIASTIAAPAYADGGGETGWAGFSPAFATVDTPAFAQLTDGSGLVVGIVRASDNTLWYTLSPSNFLLIPGNGTTPSAPAVVIYNNQTLVFHHGFNNQIFYSRFTRGSTQAQDTWTSWTAIPNNVTTVATPAVAVFNGLLTVIYTGENQQLWKITYNGSTWSNATEIPGNAITTSSPAITTTLNTPLSAGKLFIAYRNSNNQLHWTTMSTTGSTTGWKVIPGGGVSASAPAAVAYGSSNHLVDVAIRDATGLIGWNELNATTGTWRATGNSWSVATGTATTLSSPDFFHQVDSKNDAAVLRIRGNPGNQILSRA
jgi:hypothetical protein